MEHSPFAAVFQALNAAHVQYLVVGGLAVVLHGRLRTTADLDLVLSLDSKNLQQAVKALETLHFRPRAPVAFLDFVDAQKRKLWIEEKGLMVFSVWSPKFSALEIDLFVQEPFQFSEVYRRALKVDIGGLEVTVISLDDLIQMKRKAGRRIDLEDVQALEAIRDEDG